MVADKREGLEIYSVCVSGAWPLRSAVVRPLSGLELLPRECGTRRGRGLCAYMYIVLERLYVRVRCVCLVCLCTVSASSDREQTERDSAKKYYKKKSFFVFAIYI